MIHQYRIGIEDYSLELPGGIIEEQDIIAAGMRELEEETGYTGTPEIIGTMHLTQHFLQTNSIRYM